MIQWLNVRAVGAIKASVFEGRTLSSAPSLSLSSFFLLSALSLPLLSSPLLPPANPGWFEGWCADLVIQIKATIVSSGPPFLSACVLDLSSYCQPWSCGQRRPYKAKHSFSSTSVNSDTVTQNQQTPLTWLSPPPQRGLCSLVQAWEMSVFYIIYVYVMVVFVNLANVIFANTSIFLGLDFLLLSK